MLMKTSSEIKSYLTSVIIQKIQNITVTNGDFNMTYTCRAVHSNFNIAYFQFELHWDIDSKETLYALVNNFRECKEQLPCR